MKARSRTCRLNVEPLEELLPLVLEPPRDHDHAVVEELAAEVAERHARGLPDRRIRPFSREQS